MIAVTQEVGDARNEDLIIKAKIFTELSREWQTAVFMIILPGNIWVPYNWSKHFWGCLVKNLQLMLGFYA